MKKIILILVVVLASCKKEGCIDLNAINYNPNAQVDDGTCQYEAVNNSISGRIKNDLTLTSDKVWTLLGRVSVVNGATLTIEPGTIIKGEVGTGANASALIISKGSKIIANGTPEKPIIFTSISDNIQLGELFGSNLAEDYTGLWGGLIICGNAPISADAESVQIEGIPASDQSGLYGGLQSADDSGILNYVSIRHGGANIGEGNEINGLTLGGVGSGTTIQNIEIVGNQDDGIELFGGTVNVSNILVWSVGDDYVDIDQAYNGVVDGVLIVPNGGDHVIEADGGEGNYNEPFEIKNCTILSDDTTYAHFRDFAIGSLNYGGTVSFQHEPGTVVNINTMTNEINQDIFYWTFWSNR